MHKKKALIVYPRTPPTFWSFTYATNFQGKASAFPPLGALTVAGFFPMEEWDLTVVDTNVDKLTEKQLEDTEYVFVSGMNIHHTSIQEIIQRARTHNKKTILGGPIVSTLKPEIRLADIHVEGEVETFFKEFLNDLVQGKAKAYYKSPIKPPLRNIPLPRWDLVNIHKYNSMSVQFSRGCPFNCEFCDITKIYGRFPRVKEKHEFLKELDHLYNHGWRGPVFIVDDNFIGNIPAIKQLLPLIEAWQRGKKYPFTLYTEASVNLANHKDVLTNMVKAGFDKVFLGIETPVKESLLESRKVQNTVSDLLEAVKTIQQAGINAMSGFIIGFDKDPHDIFAIQEKFIQESAIPIAMVGLLTAIPGTDLYNRLEQEGRILNDGSGNNTDAMLNFIPIMNKESLVSRYKVLLQRLYDPQSYYQRAATMLERMKNAPKYNPTRLTWSNARALLHSLIAQGIITKGRRHYWKYLLKTIFHYPKRIEEAVTLAVMGYHFQKIANTDELQKKHASHTMNTKLPIKGWQKTSVIDYPDKVCTTLFLGGCNMECGYCYNRKLATNHRDMPSIPESDILQFLEKRKNVLDGVCITGGEPTIHKELPVLLAKIKERGYAIKLDTNGSNPDVVEQLINDRLVDYIAMDVKASEDNYNKVTNTKVNLQNIKRTVNIIMLSGIDYEFRMAVIPSQTTMQDIEKIGTWLKGSKRFFMQKFKPTDEMRDKQLLKEDPLSDDLLKKFRERLQQSIQEVQIRGVEYE